MQSAPERSCLVEIHDAHPSARAALETLFALLPAPAREKAAWLIVPHWYNREPLSADPDFCTWLKALPGEKVLHAYAHYRRTSFMQRFALGTEDESEFGLLSQEEAEEKLCAGRDLFFSALAQEARWFCAPRWHQSIGTTAALQSCGFEGWMHRALHLQNGHSLHMPALCFDFGRKPWCHTVARVVTEQQFKKHFASGTGFRITLHPGDLEQEKTVTLIQRIFAQIHAANWRFLSLPELMKQ